MRYTYQKTTSFWKTGSLFVFLAFPSVFLLLQTMPNEANSSVRTSQEDYVFENSKDSSNKEVLTFKPQSKKIINRKDYFYLNSLSNYYCKVITGDCTGSTLKINPFSRNYTAASTGMKIFAKKCSQCHGFDGKGKGVRASKLNNDPARLSLVGSGVLEKDAYLYWSIAEGGEKMGTDMPGYRESFTENEIWSLVTYIENL